jgi:hypothetical protein
MTHKVDLIRGIHKRFTGIRRGTRVRDADLGWPMLPIPPVGRFNGNNLFRDLRGKSWHSAQRALQIEEGLFRRLEAARGSEADEALVLARIRLTEARLKLDLGTIAAVYSISAAGGIPIASCNGGSFGDDHGEPFPVVTFYWPAPLMVVLRQCVAATGVSLWTHHRGELVIGADYIRRFLLFSRALQERRLKLERAGSSSQARAGLNVPEPQG